MPRAIRARDKVPDLKGLNVSITLLFVSERTFLRMFAFSMSLAVPYFKLLCVSWFDGEAEYSIPFFCCRYVQLTFRNN